MKFWRCFVEQSFYFLISLNNDFTLLFHEYCFIYFIYSASCIKTVIKPLSYSRFSFFPWNIIGFSIFRVLKKLLPMICKSAVTKCWWSLSIKLVPAQLHGKMVLSWRKTLTSILETHLLKWNILDLIGFVSEYRTVGSPNLILVGKNAFTNGSSKILCTLMNSTRLFRKDILQIVVGTFLLALDISGLNILNSIISRAREYHWKYTEFLSSSRLSR